MNKQQKTYGLLIAVLIVWGIIGYQIYIRLNPPTPKLETNIIEASFKKQQVIKQSFYQLKSAYRDPFLGKLPKKKKTVKKKRPIKKPKQAVRFPKIIYNGIIKVNESSSYIITIQGNQEIIKIGQIFKDVKLIKADENEIQIEFKNEKKVIAKQ